MARTVPLSDHTHPRDPVTRCSVCDWNEARIVALEAALREIAEMDQPDPLYSAVRIAERALAQEARSEWARAPGSRDVKPARLPSNPLYDPIYKARTLGIDPTLPTLCVYCVADLGVDDSERARQHRCDASNHEGNQS